MARRAPRTAADDFADHQIELSVGPTLADVDLGRQRSEIFVASWAMRRARNAQ